MNGSRILVVLAVVASGALEVGAADTLANSHDLSVGWQFKPGDDAGWSEPSLDDSGWLPIQVGSPWENQGFAELDGYAWYRLRFRVPNELLESPDVRKHGRLKFTLGSIDDVDQTWLNGDLLGATGSFPESYGTSWSTLRVYLAPSRLIRQDADNVLAVRVFDGTNEGGMREGPYRLEPAAASDLVQMACDFGDADGIYLDAEAVPFQVILSNEASLEMDGEVTWRVETDEGRELLKKTTRQTLSVAGQIALRCPFTPSTPGFYRVSCSFRHQGSEGIRIAAERIIGYRPEQIQAPLTKEDDFDAFWRRTLGRLAEVAPEYCLTRQPQLDSSTHTVYEVTMRSLDGVRVGGWYERPKAATNAPYPALLLLPGYGASMRPTGRSEPWAMLSFNVRGHGNSQADVSGVPEDYWIRGLDDREGYYYQGAYADCVRAVDFLASRPEVDLGRLAVTGGSQGGGLSLATAALDPRVRLCAPDIPFLCDWVRYFKTSDWPEMDEWVKARPDRSWEQTLRTLSYFDTLNLADRVRCPVFMGIGLQDPVCPAVTVFGVYNRLAVPKEYRVYPEAEHWVGSTHEGARQRWIRNHFRQ